MNIKFVPVESSSFFIKSASIVGLILLNTNYSLAIANPVLEVKQITTIQSSTIADNTWTNGWKWNFNLTVPDNESILKIKFSDWASGQNTIPINGNMRVYSPQSLNATSTSNAITLTGSNTYSEAINLDTTADLDTTTTGRQIQLSIETRTPTNTAGGSYISTYGISSTIDLATSDVIAKISSLPSITNLTLTDSASTTEARTAYNLLSASQQSLVTNLSTLQAVEAQITALMNGNNSVTALETASLLDLTQINNLTSAESALVTASSSLSLIADGIGKTSLITRFNTSSLIVTNARTAYNNVSSTNDQAIADVVINQISLLPSIANLILNDSTSITSARTAYNALTANQKSLVTNLNVLQALESQITAINNATSDVTNLETLTASDLTILSNIISAETAVATASSSVSLVQTGIIRTDLNTRLASSTTFVANARLTYDNLTVQNNLTQINNVIAQISALPSISNLVIADATALTNARTAYNALTVTQQASVTNLNTLQTLEAEMTLITNATNDIVTLETALASNLALVANITASENAIVTASNSIALLSTGVSKTSLTTRLNTATLTTTNARTTYNNNLSAANIVTGLIATLTDSASVSTARLAYSFLTPAQQALVTNLNVLQIAEGQVTAINFAASAIVALTNATGLNLTALPNLLDAESKLALASSSITQVNTGTAKTSLVNSYNPLASIVTNARIAYDILSNQNDQISANNVINLITGLADYPDVLNARFAYDQLTTSQQALVINLNILLDAEAQTVAMVNASNNVDSLEIAVRDYYAMPSPNTLTSVQLTIVNASSSVSLLNEGTIKTSLGNRVTVAISVAETILSVVDLETAVTMDLTVLNNLISAEMAVVNASSSLILIPSGTIKTDLTNRFNSATSLVTNARTAYNNNFSPTANDQIMANNVINLISTALDYISVMNARTAYDALTPIQQSLVTNINTLTNNEGQSAIINAENAVTTVEMFASVVDLTLLENLIEAETTIAIASSSVLFVQAGLVQTELSTRLANYTTIIATARATYNLLNQNDQAIADIVINKIASLTDYASVTDARTAYNALTPNQKTLVTNLTVLLDTENAIIDVTELEYIVQTYINSQTSWSATLFDSAVFKASASVSLLNTGTIKTSLTERINSAFRLQEVILAIIYLEDLILLGLEDVNILSAAEISIANIDNLLTAIPQGTIKNSLITRLDAARFLVTNARTFYNSTLPPQAPITPADQAAADVVINLISTVSDYISVMNARTAYDALTPIQQSLVTNIANLLAVEDQANLIINADNAVGTLETFLIDGFDLTILDNLVTAETFVIGASNAIALLAPSTVKTDLMTRFDNASLVVTNARTAYNIANP